MKWSTLFGSALLILGAPILAGPGGNATAVAQVIHTPTGCNNCHRLHGSPGPQLLQAEVLEELCLSCHNDATPYPGAPQGPFAVHDGPKHSTPTSCAECHGHQANDGGNLSLIRAVIPVDLGGAEPANLPVVFTSRGTDAGQASLNSFADNDEDGDGDWDGVCEVCHTNTSNHRNGFDLPDNPDNSNHGHNTGRTCSDCHTHSGGFAGGGPCATCHDTGGDGTIGPNSRRPIIPEFNPSQVSSRHVDFTYPPALPANDWSPDCEVCHEQSEHQQGTVRLWNVDAPGDIGSAIVVNGDPYTDPSVADDLEVFCLACHDTNQANGSAPFSQGATPPVIDATAWNASSHQNSGDATCFDCHQSGHGSNKVTMLAPRDYVDDGDPDDPLQQEERFCFRCHNPTGPSTFDLETPFSYPINWVPEPAGLDDNADLNDRHDVQFTAQNRSGAILECVNCHNPHAATSARPWIQDPDPNDGHVPGTDWYFTGYQTAGDELSEFCLDCHDGGFPPGVQGHTDAPGGQDSPNVPLVNIQATWGADGMGGRTASKVQIEASTGWGTGFVLACTECHSPHPVYDADISSTTLFGLNDFTRATDGTPLQGYDASGTLTSVYGVQTTNGDPQFDPGTWCMTCHNRTNMTNKGQDCTDCHRHGDGSRW